MLWRKFGTGRWLALVAMLCVALPLTGFDTYGTGNVMAAGQSALKLKPKERE